MIFLVQIKTYVNAIVFLANVKNLQQLDFRNVQLNYQDYQYNFHKISNA